MSDLPVQHGFVRYQLPAILWTVLIFVGSSIPGDDFPSLAIFSYDKVIHFVLFLSLCFFAYRAARFQSRFPVLSRNALRVSLLFCVLYGAIDELHQFLIPGRSPETLDLLADSLGAATSALFVWASSKIYPRRDAASK